MNSEDKLKVYGVYECDECGKRMEWDSVNDSEVMPSGKVYKKCECGGTYRQVNAGKVEYSTKNDDNEVLKEFKMIVEEEAMTDKEKKARDSRVNKAFGNYVVEQYKESYEELIQKRNEDFKLSVEGFLATKDEQELKGKVDCYSLMRILSKPLGFVVGRKFKYSSYDLKLASDFYWDSVEYICDRIEKPKLVPTIQQLCSMLGISVTEMSKYYANGDDEIRGTIEFIRDKFVDFYISRGMTNDVNTIMSIFVLKSSYGLKEEQQEQKVVVEHKLVRDENLEGAKNRLGDDKFIEIDCEEL